jgi:signal transduction histidine kinase
VAFTAAELPVLGTEVEAALYRVAQEALHNALRHAGASGVRVGLSRTVRRVVLEVADDGHGFAPGTPPGGPKALQGGPKAPPGGPGAPSSGLGLASMRERAAAAGGVLTITSGEAGTLVRMTVPVKAGGERWRSPSRS